MKVVVRATLSKTPSLSFEPNFESDSRGHCCNMYFGTCTSIVPASRCTAPYGRRSQLYGYCSSACEGFLLLLRADAAQCTCQRKSREQIARLEQPPAPVDRSLALGVCPVSLALQGGGAGYAGRRCQRLSTARASTASEGTRGGRWATGPTIDPTGCLVAGLWGAPG